MRLIIGCPLCGWGCDVLLRCEVTSLTSKLELSLCRDCIDEINKQPPIPPWTIFYRGDTLLKAEPKSVASEGALSKAWQMTKKGERNG